MAIPYSTKVNEQGATPVTNEPHIIGISGTATYTPGLIRLTQVPQGPAPAVVIPGYIEITVGTPTGNQFLVNYTTGVIAFDVSLSGTPIVVNSYDGLGSEIAAEDVNELQNPVSAIIQQNITYNWPLAPTLTWNLAPNSVTNSSISATAAISLSKLQSLTPNTAVATDGSGILISSSVTALQLSYVDATSSIQTQLNGKQASGNYIISLTGDVSATGPGTVAATVNFVGGSSAANVNSATIAANAATDVDTFSTIVKRDGAGKFSISSIAFKDSGIKTVTLKSPTTLTNSYILNWPLDQGFAGYTLQNDGAGNLSWVLGTGGGTPGLPLNSLQYNNGGTFGGTSGVIWSSGPGTLFMNTPTGPCLNLTAASQGIQLNNLCGIDGSTYLNAQQVYASTTPSFFSDPSAVLQADSTTQGFLPPRMTSTQRLAIASAATGLVVYDTTLNQWMGWNASGWVILG